MKDIVKEFFDLEYKEKSPSKRVSDMEIGNLVVGRLDKNGYLIYYLHSGSSILIPWKWIDFFGQLFVHSGHKILNRDYNKEDKFESLVYWMTKLQEKLMIRNNILEVIGQICEIGTNEFRKEYSDFLPIQYSSRIKQIEI